MAEDTKVEQINWIGKQVWFYMAPFWILCHVTKSRANFGRTDLQISPVDGSGNKWVKEKNIERAQKET